jgi:hypothetical protein
MKNHTLVVFIMLCTLLFSAVVNSTDQTTGYSTPPQFMDLYFDFTGKEESDFPKGQKTISDYLIQSQKEKYKADTGPLIMFLDSSVYIYDQNRKLLYSKLMRTNRSSGFFEMTAISHIGPALSYLAKVKQNGDPAWKTGMADLLQSIKEVKALNAQTENNWLDRANIKAWQAHKDQIRAMIDYALSMAGNYIVSVQNGAAFDLNSVQKNFLSGNEEYPIPYNSVMVATFMLTAIQSMSAIHDDLANLNIDWPHAKVLIRNQAGSNVSSGLTTGTNWMVPFLNALSNNQIPADRILITPYAKVQADAGEDPLSEASYQYYTSSVWGSIYNRSKIAQAVFTDLETIYLPGRPAIPGDYGYSKASDVNDFMIRLKHSLQDPREMLSNTVGFWMAGEMQNKNWDVTKAAIPGLTTGFPEGINAYPTENPPIKNSSQ